MMVYIYFLKFVFGVNFFLLFKVLSEVFCNKLLVFFLLVVNLNVK